jgi:hypothetical protein
MKFRSLAPLIVLALLTPALHAEDDSPAFIVKNDLVASPVAPGSTAPQLVNAPDGTVYLSWLEPAPARHTALRFARFDAATRTWSPARTIGESIAQSVPVNLIPSLAVSSTIPPPISPRSPHRPTAASTGAAPSSSTVRPASPPTPRSSPCPTDNSSPPGSNPREKAVPSSPAPRHRTPRPWLSIRP